MWIGIGYFTCGSQKEDEEDSGDAHKILYLCHFFLFLKLRLLRDQSMGVVSYFYSKPKL